MERPERGTLETLIEEGTAKLNLDVRLRHPRAFVRFIAKHFKRPVTGVEIGVWTGENAESMMKHANIKNLYLIDPYVKYEGYPDYKDGDMEAAKMKARERLAQWREKCAWIPRLSWRAKELFKKGELDFVYIDGNHEGDYPARDIKDWWPLVKLGGVFGGDDFDYYPVAKAVVNFAQRTGIEPAELGKEWIFVKE